MNVLWGIHNDQPTIDLLEGGFISIGWDELGDLRDIGPDRDLLKAHIASTYSTVKPGAIPVWAGVLMRFMDEMEIGDFVVAPNKADSTVSIGRITSDFYVEPAVEVHRNRRRVEWLHTGEPRATFSQSARHEIGSAMTLFRVKRNAPEFLAMVTGVSPVSATDPAFDDSATDPTEGDLDAARVEAFSSDFIVDVLTAMDPFRFEHFTAALLRAMGYLAQPTQASGDGGVDVIAYRDPLGLEPPIIKVQCKRTLSTIGGPAVQQLVGALAHGGAEVGLFVTLGAYSSDALHIERTHHALRLCNGTQLVEMILEHYDRLEPEWKRMLPLRQVYAVDRTLESA